MSQTTDAYQDEQIVEGSMHGDGRRSICSSDASRSQDLFCDALVGSSIRLPGCVVLCV